MNRFRNYFSLTGSFSRLDLFVATLLLAGAAVLVTTLKQTYPDKISDVVYASMFYALYPVWGAAIGKRSRDIGTTFTYGMIIGMVFPVIGIVFLFQPGKKAQARNS